MHSEGSYSAKEHQTRQDDNRDEILNAPPVDRGDEVTQKWDYHFLFY